MEPRFTRGEYWILETAVEARIPVWMLLTEGYPEENGIEIMFNKTGHGLSVERLLETLDGLATRGLIEFHGYLGKRDRGEPLLVEWSKKRAEDWLWQNPNEEGPRHPYYSLTEEGGDQWEAFASPRWEAYLHTSTQNQAEVPGSNHVIEDLVVRCVDRVHLERHLTEWAMVDSTIVLDSAVITEEEPFHATYWKVLPRCWVATYRMNQSRQAPEADSQAELLFLASHSIRYEQDRWYRWR